MPLSFLSSIRVLDLSQYIPGPYCAQVLADLGATVVKVEPPAGDPMRRFDPPDPDGLPPAYKLINAGKTVTLIDLKSDEGRARFEKLLIRADVLVESFRPGTLERLGFGRARVEALNPRL
ncbi:MAG TPA: CoA transferase, partial [Azospirillaceae bacterium]|nr:CoA transferase [Azospirillaceae bacterium]